MTAFIHDRHAKQRGVKRDWETKVARVIRGDSTSHSQGYRLLYLPMHPEATGGYVYEHRIVASATLGRLLRSNEVVHHLNHDKCDNRPENLAVLESQSEHSKHHTFVTDAELEQLLSLGTPANRLWPLGISTQRLARARKALIVRGVRPLTCGLGHTMTRGNTAVSKRGAFICRTCQKQRAAARYAR